MFHLSGVIEINTMKTEIRKGVSQFYDDANFPRGFNRSGEFSVAESNILTDYGLTLKKLADGSLMPENPEEKQFADVCAQKLEAETQVERAWQKYISLTTTPKKFQSIYGSHRPNDDFEYSSSDDLDDL